MPSQKLFTEEIDINFTNDEVNLQVERILTHPHFRNSPTLTRFLLFIISETMHGKQQQIKEYSIAVNVLNRPPDFNPHDDAVVRIHAGRLRRVLNDYYMIQGINDPIIIHIPKGCYVPQFEGYIPERSIKLNLHNSPEPGIKSILAVFPFRVISNTAEIKNFAAILSEQLSADLSKLKHRSVIGYYSLEMTAKIEQNFLEAAKLLGAEYIVTGSVLDNGQHTQVFINVLKAGNGEIMIAKSFDSKIQSPGIVDMHDEIIKTVVEAMS